MRAIPEIFRSSRGIILGRNPHKVIAVLSALLVCSGVLHAQVPIGGEVNSYVPVLEVIPCDSAVLVGNAAGFNPGDIVFIIQMKGARIHQDNDSTFGSITDLRSAGSCEFLSISAVSGNKITFSTRIGNLYDPASLVQLIRVPRYASARITRPLTAPPWNGTTGGVVVVWVDGDLIFDANINVDAKGFAGGNVSPTITALNRTAYLYNWLTGSAGEKGEGVARSAWPYPIAGRGRFASGGGGGNGTNAGGGGGGNGGAGGKGGWSSEHNLPENWDVGGLPGQSISALAPKGRYVLGGGGGGGQQNDVKGSAGGAGGGIVVIKARTIHGQGYTISARGASSLSTPDDVQGDGTGGGGAGGTVVLDVEAVSSRLNISVNGGNSGDVLSQYNPHGPGGGGGGGVIALSKSFPNISVDVKGGVAGLNLGQHHSFSNTTWGATDGQPGVVHYEVVWPVPLSIGLDVWGGGPMCGTQTVTIHATPGFASYRWSNGDTTSSITVNSPGDYSVVAVDPSGCVFSSKTVRAFNNNPRYNLAGHIDYGKVDYRKNYIHRLTLANTDDEDIVVEKISNAPDIAVIAPILFPVTIPAGGSIEILVRLFTSKESDYNDTLRVYISAPCPDTGIVTVHAEMNLVRALFSMPDTSAYVGSTGFKMPVYLRLDPDTLILPATNVVIDVEFDSRVFAPANVTVGKITGDIIDVFANRRRLTIAFDSVDLTGPVMMLTQIIGTVLNSYVTQTTFDITNVRYVKVFQTPITEITNGLLNVSPVCYQQGRQITIYGMPSAVIVPNPASESVQITIDLSAPGLYVLTLLNELGQQVDTFTYSKEGHDNETVTSVVNVERWPSGAYSVIFTTPLFTTQTNLIIAR